MDSRLSPQSLIGQALSLIYTPTSSLDLESSGLMLLHARVLAELLVYPQDRPHKDDVLRTDFAAQWIPEPEDAAQRIYESREIINKQLAHMTWSRVTDAELPWDYEPDLAGDVVEVVDAWCNHVNDDDLTAPLRIAVDEARSLLTERG
jgi:hypothetical protein